MLAYIVRTEGFRTRVDRPLAVSATSASLLFSPGMLPIIKSAAAVSAISCTHETSSRWWVQPALSMPSTT